MKLPETAREFFNLIPTDPNENLEFRIKLHSECAVDKGFRRVFLKFCRDYKPVIFNTTFWTFDPQNRINHPFVLWSHQIPAVETLDRCIQEGRNVGINKTRKQGASEICCKLFVANCLLYEYNNFIVGSRKESLVDNFGDQTTLFAKIDNAFDCLPTWWKRLIEYDKNKNRKSMVVEIPTTCSAIIGETTNQSFSAGSRATALLLDEFGRVDVSDAKSIEGSVKDVSNCIIYSSTHWFGVKHPFYKALQRPTTTVVSLMWYDNPIEKQGLYKTSEPGQYELVDKKYYKNREIVVLNDIHQYSVEETRAQIIADGLRSYPCPYRAPWFDFHNFDRLDDRRDFICNVCASPSGSTDAPFDSGMLEEIKKKTIRPPDYEGELERIDFVPDWGQKRIKWWGTLIKDRPNQRHNYIIAVDPSYGLGSANSAIMIIDVNLSEQVGEWVDAYTEPPELADFVADLAEWIGGVTKPFVIWEANAGCGTKFTDRIVSLNYPNLYTQRREDSKTRKKTKKWGYRSNTKAKEDILGQLATALNNGLRQKNEPKLIIHSEELLNELSDYVFKEGGTGIVQSSRVDLSTGAQERHGDRGIAAALSVLGMKEQPKGNYEETTVPLQGSFMARMKKWKAEEEENKKYARRYLYP